MTADTVLWTYALAADVVAVPGEGGAGLDTATGSVWLEGAGQPELLQLLAGTGSSEARIQRQLHSSGSGDDAGVSCAALLFRLDRLGFLTRSLSSRGRLLVSCVPSRAPTESAPHGPPEGQLRLSPRAFARAEGDVVWLEAPGCWARMAIHERELLGILHDLASGRSADEVAAQSLAHPGEAIRAVLALMSWCGLLQRTDEHRGWSGHDLLFHARTRAGYARASLGKTGRQVDWPERVAPGASERPGRFALKPPDLARLLAGDPPHALVCERRQSFRRQGSEPLDCGQLSEFLFRTLHERGGRRPYPSAGACYPLNVYLAVHRCRGLAPGLYAYDPLLHELTRLREPGPGLDELLLDAAGTAGVEQPPQVLLVLAALYACTRKVYGDLAYSLILKEVGAVFQTAMMAAAAMGLGTCPLGCGNSLLFTELADLDPLTETSVGEMMVSSLEDTGSG